MTQEAAKKTQIARYRRNFQARIRRQQDKLEAGRKAALKATLAVAPSVIATYPSVQRAYLFGSIVQPNRFHSESDIDIAVEGITARTYTTLWRDLEEALPEWEVDLRDISHPSPFANLIRQTGMVIYERKDTPSAS